ncbi:YrbL family protein [Aliarcobacter butzleri]|uniref:YrbL family protein n=1 Tax=Aliarcobacter butzleri TaxID=28197 RepID=UPI003AF7C64A|nr:PhoP regulatory network YrbL family protein [Aliarcobacter butzleri]
MLKKLKLELKEDLLLARGSERSVYLYPGDEYKVVKVLYNQKNNNNQNEMEYKYYKYLKDKKVSFEHITNCYGWVDTNLGKGLIFDRVLDYDCLESKQLTYFIKNKLLNCNKEILLLNELKDYLEKNGILFTDVATLNVMCKRTSINEYKLIIIDGLGPRKDNLKSFLYLNFSIYNKYKIKKQWNKFLNMVNRLK